MRKVFLGGTCNESTWRNIIIPMLNIEYFNPVVEDWTTECMDEELIQREECDFCLYTITPKMTGAYSIAELVDDSNKRPRKTVAVFLRDDGKEKFTEGQWKSLKAVGKLVASNGCKVYGNLHEAAIYMNNKSGVIATSKKLSI